MIGVDTNLFYWLNSWAGVSPLLDGLIIFRAVYLWWVVIAALAIFLLVTVLPKFRQYRTKNLRFFLEAFVAAAVARLVVTEFIRVLSRRPRPFEVLEGVRQLVGNVSTWSFPSGHAALAFAAATTTALYYPKTSVLFFAAAFSIGVGRVAAGVHWPSDILGGAMVGMGTAWLLHVGIRWKQKRRS